MPTLTVETPGKVNLVLEVLGKRPDGYHEIQSLMLSVALYDQLTFELAPSGVIELTCDDPSLPTGESNLVHRAAKALKQHAAIETGCRIHLKKRIPSAAGMGGGSSDAAATLKALNLIWSLTLSDAELARIGATLGADIPFFFAPTSAIVSGIGDCVEPVSLSWSGWIGLAATGLAVATKDVYAACRIGSNPYRPEDLLEIAKLSAADDLQPRLRNGLEAAVFDVTQEVGKLQRELAKAVGFEPRISGAGSVLFGLFDDAQSADRFVECARRCDAVRHALKVKAPGCMRITQGDSNHGNQRRPSEADRKR